MKGFYFLATDSYSMSMLFEGDDDCKARCRAAAGYVHPTSDRTLELGEDTAAPVIVSSL